MTSSNPVAALDHAVTIVRRVCELGGNASCIQDLQTELRTSGVAEAVERHDMPGLFDWLMSILSYQGIANRVAEGFIRDHGNVTWSDISHALAQPQACKKLDGYWRFYDCRYHKGLQTCTEPHHFSSCSLPHHVLRNGHLNQTAYSLYFFIRDVADGDLVAWIDQQLTDAASFASPDRIGAMRHALVDPLRGVYGVSDKVLSMALALLLIGAGKRRRYWFETGISFIVVDTIVHNFLHRTGILSRLGASHAYGPACYRHGGCADVLQLIAGQIDGKRFNPAFPSPFPWFVQHAVWRYCAEGELDVCNGTQINDRQRCDLLYCRVRSLCDRVVLHGN